MCTGMRFWVYGSYATEMALFIAQNISQKIKDQSDQGS